MRKKGKKTLRRKTTKHENTNLRRFRKHQFHTHTQMMQRKGMAKEKTKQNNKLTILETVLLFFG